MADEAKPVLPAFTHTVSIEHRTIEGKMLSGDFTFKRLTLMETGKVGALLAQLNGGNPVDQTTDALHTMIAELTYGIAKAPDWWDVNSIYESELLRKVWEAFFAYQKSFRRPESQ